MIEAYLYNFVEDGLYKSIAYKLRMVPFYQNDEEVHRDNAVQLGQIQLRHYYPCLRLVCGVYSTLLTVYLAQIVCFKLGLFVRPTSAHKVDAISKYD